MPLPSITFTGTVYRAINPRWSMSPLSGEGAKRFGGRFNPVGTPAFYTSLSLQTCWREAQQGFIHKEQPLTICVFDVACENVMNLTDDNVRRQLGITVDDLDCAWENIMHQGQTPPSWQISKRLTEEGIAAIIVPSFARAASARDVNMVFFDWTDERPHRVRLIDEEQRLPQNAKSWTP